jgi:hypothetical protein
LVTTVLMEHVVHIWPANVLTRVQGLLASRIYLSVAVDVAVIMDHNVAVLLNVLVSHISIVYD